MRCIRSLCYLQLRVSQNRYLLGDVVLRWSHRRSLPSWRLIRPARRRRRTIRARKPFPSSFFIPAVGDQCSGMFLIRDSSSDIFATSRFLFFFLSFSSENNNPFSFSLLLNHLHRRRRFIIVRGKCHCHTTRPVNPSRLIRHSIKFRD